MTTLFPLETVFSLGGSLVMPFWLLMIVLPTWRWTQRIAQSPWIVIGPALGYVLLVLPNASAVFAAVSGGSMEQVVALLGTPFGTTVSWMHFLAFDLFVGRWIYLDSRERRVHPLLMAPVLFFTFMLGPVGFVAYLVVRAVHQAVRQPRPATATQAHVS